MKKVLYTHFAKYLLVAPIFLAVATFAWPNFASAALVVDLKVNASDGPTVALGTGVSYSFLWNTQSASSCQQSSPISSGIALSGVSQTFNPGDPYYPTATTPVVITIFCDDGAGTTLSDSITVSLTVPPPPAASSTVDLKVNGSDGPNVALTSGGTYSFTWTSANATSCQQSSPVSSGIALTGVSQTFTSADPYYPTAGSPVVITVTCDNGPSTPSVSDSITVSFSAGSTGGTGGGGGGGGSAGGTPLPPLGGGSATSTVATTTCLFVQSYLGKDRVNDPIEVMKLQSFFKVFMGYSEVQINGVFDEATYNAVGAFQTLYKNEILTPWGISEPTHYVYILSLKKINSIYCQQILPISQSEQQEIDAYKALIQSLKDQGIDVNSATNTATSTGVTLPEVGFDNSKGQNLRSLGAVLFALPDNLKDILPFILRLIVLAIVLYFLINVIWNVLEKPSVRASFKSWYLVIVARIKSLWKKSTEIKSEVSEV